jgi:hypothetical protein
MSGAPNPLSVITGTATTTETLVDIPYPFRRGYPNSNQTQPTPPPKKNFLQEEVSLFNRDATNNLLVRINAGQGQITVLPKTERKLSRAIVHTISVQASAGTVAYEIIGASS